MLIFCMLLSVCRCFDIILDNGKTIDIIDALQDSCNHDETDFKTNEVRVTCKDVIASNNLNTNTISFRKYKLIKAIEFTKENGEPPNKARNLPPLEVYKVSYCKNCKTLYAHQALCVHLLSTFFIFYFTLILLLFYLFDVPFFKKCGETKAQCRNLSYTQRTGEMSR